MKLDYATYLANPALRSSLATEARRQRALAIHRLVFAPIAAFFRRPQKGRSTGSSMPLVRT